VPEPIAIWNSARDAWEMPGTAGLFCEHLDVYSETFPTSGMTSSGVAFELPTWEHRTPASGSLSSPGFALLPTVTVSDTNGPGMHGDGGLDLRTAVSLFPTPRATDGDKGGPNQRGSSGDYMLPAISNLLPPPKEAKLLQTPSVADALGGHERRGGKRSKELLLNGQAKELAKLPTPRATRGGSSTETVELLGAITNQPSGVGNSSPVDQFPGQQSLLDALVESD